MGEIFVSNNEQETIEAGKRFAVRLTPGSVVALFGDLGSGKTRFIKGICSGLGINKHVSSPSFTIIHEYPISWGTVYHFDFYRVESVQEIVDLGFSEYFQPNTICLIEWAEKALHLLPPKRFEITMGLGRDQTTRLIRIEETVEEHA